MQKKTLTWTNPPTNDADEPHTENNNQGYMASVDGATPHSFDGLKYGTSFDLSGIISTLKPGTHTISIAAVTTDGVVGDYSTPTSFTVFPRPRAPSNVSIT